MKRRDFVRYTAPAVTIPLFFKGMSLKAMSNSPILNALSKSAGYVADDRVLVIVQLSGGNDGVNTVLPIDQYAYLSLDNSQGGRSNILIPEAKGLKLEIQGVDQYPSTRLSPGLTSFQKLFGEEKLGLVQGVGYQNPNFSHFRATDIWLSGSDENVVETTGWIGRDLDIQYPNYYNNPYKGPLAITMGSVSSNTFLGNMDNYGLAVQDPRSNYGYMAGNNDVAPNSFHGYELEYVRGVIQTSNEYTASINDAYNRGSNAVSYPGTYLAYQLQMVARMISGGLGTKVYLVNAGGFDTHTDQHDHFDASNGYHVNLWKQIGEAIQAFQNDLAAQTDSVGNKLEDKVIGYTFSEFGRTIKSNTTYGTDHGTTGPVFLFGSNINAAMLGKNPEVYNAAGSYMESDLPLQFDYRSIYATILHQWFAVPTSDIDTIFSKTFQDENTIGQDINDLGFHANLPIFKSSFTPRVSAVKENNAVAVHKANYPNPFSGETVIPINSEGERIVVTVYNANGQVVRELASGFYAKGEHELRFSGEGLAKGVYLYKVSGEHQSYSKQMLVE